MAIYWKPEACRLTVLPDRSGLIGQKFLENVKIDKFKWDILGYFSTLSLVEKIQMGHLVIFKHCAAQGA